jgi:hypothetical protein
MAAQTNGTVGAGTYFVEGLTLSAAFSNPLSLDLIQVVNKSGKIVWNLTATGSVNTNPVSPTTDALLGKYFGANFSEAFAPNPLRYDVFQVVGPSGAGIFHVDYTGAAYSD